jgi:class 3 adenylate cyclase
MSYSVIGDTVNTASRLCAAAKAGQIIISENSRNCVEDHFELVEIEAVRAKGKFNPIRAFTVARELSPHLGITAGRENERSHPSPFPVTAPATKSI